MALPIKKTPVLKGKDARRFVERMNTAASRKISKEERAQMLAVHEEFVKNFPDMA